MRIKFLLIFITVVLVGEFCASALEIHYEQILNEKYDKAK